MLATFKNFVYGFFRAKFLRRHFRRLFVLESAPPLRATRDAPPDITRNLLDRATLDEPELLERLATRRGGLYAEEIEAIREKAGWNEVEHEKPVTAWRHLWLAYYNPFNMLLTFLAGFMAWQTYAGQSGARAAQAATDAAAASDAAVDAAAASDAADAAAAAAAAVDAARPLEALILWAPVLIVITLVLFSTLLRFWQELKACREADALKAMVRNTATVLRPLNPDDPCRDASDECPVDAAPALPVLPPSDLAAPCKTEIPLRELVPGDMIHLSAGDMIPADCRVLSAKDLFVSQAAMTGESLPVEKFARRAPASAANPLDLDNLLFMGTNVISGAATAVAVGTGNQTYFGAIAQRVAASEENAGGFQAGINQVSWLLIRFMLIMTPLVFVLNGWTKGWMEALMFALSVAVGLTPEMLPMIVTGTLAKGAVFLSRKKVIVKRLDAIQSFGAMDVLCTDKTGTLTQDKVVLAHHLDIWGGQSDETLDMAYLNSYYQTGLRNLLDAAVMEYRDVAADLKPGVNYRALDEIPWDFTRKRMSVVVEDRVRNRHLLICKGAVEEILSCCTRASHGDGDEALTPDLLTHVRMVTTDLNEDGLRSVAVAVKEVPPDKTAYGVTDECDLDLIGYIAFLDPPKETAETAIASLRRHGVAVKVLTGDNELVARKVCADVGLASETGAAITGPEIEEMDEQALSAAARDNTIFARLSPLHKARLVEALKNRGHVVGFMGDGINDAPALRKADIGISVDTGVDIAREAADIILLEKNLLVLEEGVREGRRTFANMLKYVNMTASSNFGNMFSVLVAGWCLPFLPMLPLHLLIQNLLYNFAQTAIPFDRVDEVQIARPLRWNSAGLGRFMIWFGPISSIFDILAFALMWWWMDVKDIFRRGETLLQAAEAAAESATAAVQMTANHIAGLTNEGNALTAEAATLFQSGWFVVGLLTQLLVVHMIRTTRVPFIQSIASWPMLLATLAVAVLAVALPMGPWAPLVLMDSLPGLFFVYLPFIVFPYMALTQWVKMAYIRRYGWQ